MKVPTKLLDDLENLYDLQQQGGINNQEFDNAKQEILASLLKSDVLTSTHLKSAHHLLGKQILTKEEYDKLKKLF